MTESNPRNASFQLILDTAEQLIQEKGCRQTTLQDIIDKSGLSKGAIYHYVSGKDELFALILKMRMEQMNAAFFHVVAQPSTQGVENPLHTIVQGMGQNTGQGDVSNKIFIYLLSQMDNPKVADLVKHIYEFVRQTAAKWIETGQQSGVIPQSINAEKTALIFVTFMYGLRVQNTIDPGQGKLEMNDIFQLMFRSLQ